MIGQTRSTRLTLTLVAALAASLPACGSSNGSTGSSGDGGSGTEGGGPGGSCPTQWSTLVAFAQIASDDVVRDMHVDGSTLYYSSQGGIFSVPLGGGMPTTVVSVPSPGAVQSFTVLADGIDYVQGSELAKVPKSGGSPSMLAMLADYGGQALERSGDVWTDGKTVIWPSTTTDTGGNTIMGIHAMDLSSQTKTDLVTAAQDTISTVSVVGGTVYYNEGVAPGAPGASKVQAVPSGGGMPKTLESSGVMVAVDTGALYWGSGAGEGFAASLSRSPTAGGMGSSFAGDFQADVGNAVFVDSRAFFAGLQGGAPVIVQAPRSGGSTQVVFCLGMDDAYSIDAFDVSGKTLYVGLTRNSDMTVGIVTVPLP